MGEKKILVVYGATGKQGGSTVRTILGDPKLKNEWTVRAVTRDVSKPSAQALKELGAEVVAADMNDASTLASAVKGAYAVFAVTNYWEHLSQETETKQGIAMADTAAAAGVQHFIWSSLPNINELSHGTLPNVYHFDSKAAVAAHIRSLSLPYTLFMPGFFLSNIPGVAMRRSPSDDNNWMLMLPMPASAQIPIFDPAADTGKFVKGILLHGERSLGKEVLGATSYMAGEAIVGEFREKFPKDGKGAGYKELGHQEYKDELGQMGLPEFAQEEMLQNMRLIAEFGYYGGQDLKESHEILVDPLTTWKDYMDREEAFAGLQ